MDTRDHPLMQAMRLVRPFLIGHFDLLAPIIGTTALTRFDSTLNAVAHHLRRDPAGRAPHKGGTSNMIARLEATARRQMRVIEDVWSTDHPKSHADSVAFGLTGRSAGVSALLARGYLMADASRQHRRVFIAAGLALDFDLELVKALDALQCAVDFHSAPRRSEHPVQSGAITAARIARRAMNRLDALIAPALEGHPTMLDEWVLVTRTVDTAARAVSAVGSEQEDEESLWSARPGTAEIQAEPTLHHEP